MGSCFVEGAFGLLEKKTGNIGKCNESLQTEPLDLKIMQQAL